MYKLCRIKESYLYKDVVLRDKAMAMAGRKRSHIKTRHFRENMTDIVNVRSGFEKEIVVIDYTGGF